MRLATPHPLNDTVILKDEGRHGQDSDRLERSMNESPGPAPIQIIHIESEPNNHPDDDHEEHENTFIEPEEDDFADQGNRPPILKKIKLANTEDEKEKPIKLTAPVEDDDDDVYGQYFVIIFIVLLEIDG